MSGVTKMKAGVYMGLVFLCGVVVSGHLVALRAGHIPVAGSWIDVALGIFFAICFGLIAINANKDSHERRN